MARKQITKNKVYETRLIYDNFYFKIIDEVRDFGYLVFKYFPSITTIIFSFFVINTCLGVPIYK